MSSYTSKRVLIVGMGGIGGWLSNGVFRILGSHPDHTETPLILVDGDEFEPHNADRQFFDHYGNKAESVAEFLLRLNPEALVIPQPFWVVNDEEAAAFEIEADPDDEFEIISDKVSATDLLSEGDTVFAVVDNYAARSTICLAAEKLDNVDVFLGGNGGTEEGDGYFGSVYHYQRRDGVDITAPVQQYHSEYREPEDRNPGIMSCVERASLPTGGQTIAANMAVASYLLARFQDTIIEGNLIENGETFFDLKAGKAKSADRKPLTVKEKVG